MKDKFKFCAAGKHKFGEIFLRGIVAKDGHGYQRGYRECIRGLCSKVEELKREVWLGKDGRMLRTGPWQEDGKYKPAAPD